MPGGGSCAGRREGMWTRAPTTACNIQYTAPRASSDNRGEHAAHLAREQQRSHVPFCGRRQPADRVRTATTAVFIQQRAHALAHELDRCRVATRVEQQGAAGLAALHPAGRRERQLALGTQRAQHALRRRLSDVALEPRALRKRGQMEDDTAVARANFVGGSSPRMLHSPRTVPHHQARQRRRAAPAAGRRQA